MTIRRGRLRRWLGGDGGPSARAAIFLAASTFLCGCVLASLLFVGIWRHTAGEAQRSQAAEARIRAAHRQDVQQLQALQLTVRRLRAQLRRNHGLLADVQRRAAEAAKSLARTRAAARAAAVALTPRLQDVIDQAASLAHETATIQSEVRALESYARDPGPAGVDAGYLATQARYLERGAAAAASAAAVLAQRARDAQAAAGAG